jgi:hypothetical protein
MIGATINSVQNDIFSINILMIYILHSIIFRKTPAYFSICLSTKFNLYLLELDLVYIFIKKIN